MGACGALLPSTSGLRSGITAAAVILTIQSVFSGKLRGAKEPVLLLEIRGQKRNAEAFSGFFSDGVQTVRVFQRTDGQCGGKTIGTELRSCFRRFHETLAEADPAALPSLRVVFVPFYQAVIFLRFIR